jgi:peptide/nickel transport system substrate-binding protein
MKCWPLLCLPLAGFIAAGCGTAAAVPSDRTLRLAVEGDIKTLDPAVSSDWDSQPLVRMLYHGLLDYDEGTDLVPWLARELPQISADGRTFTFRLKRGIRFANGRELEARDCAYAIERSLDPATRSWGEGFLRHIRGAAAFTAARGKDRAAGLSGWQSEPRRVSGLETPDRHTLRVTLDKADLAFPYIMTMTFTYPVPREEVERYGEEFYRNPVGTGPFRLVRWDRALRMRFERNPHFSLPEQPRLDTVEVKLGADELIQQMMFERGELEFVSKIPEPDFVRITTDPAWRESLAVVPSNETSSFFLNCELPPFTDRRVRQAMNYAVDRRRMLRLINNRGILARGVVPPAMPGFNPALKEYPHDPQKARRLLAGAGYPNGFAVPLWIGTSSRSLKLAQWVQQDLAEVGVRVELKAVAGNVAGQAYRKRKTVPIGIQTWYMDYPDPGNFLETFLSGDRITDEDCLNFAFYNNPRVNALMRAAAAERDRPRRLALYGKAEELIVEDAPWIFLYHPVRHKLRQPWLHGFTMHPVWPGRYERLWIER